MIKVPHKMKDQKECGNYHDISLMAHLGKTLLEVVTKKLDTYCEAKGLLPKE